MSVSNMQEFFTIIGNFGFPVAVASYLLWRSEKKLESLELVNKQLVDEIKTLSDKVEDLDKTMNNIKRKK